MKLRPLQDRILVQRVEEETTTKGGIIIPDTAKEKPAEGKVVAVGNGANDAAMLHKASLGIAVLGGEGLALACLTAADIVVPDIGAALDLLLQPRRILATLRR